MFKTEDTSIVDFLKKILEYQEVKMNDKKISFDIALFCDEKYNSITEFKDFEFERTVFEEKNKLNLNVASAIKERFVDDYLGILNEFFLNIQNIGMCFLIGLLFAFFCAFISNIGFFQLFLIMVVVTIVIYIFLYVFFIRKEMLSILDMSILLLIKDIQDSYMNLKDN